MQTAKQRLAIRRQRIEDVVTGLVKGSYLGALIYGPGGDGKSYEVVKNLDRHEVKFGLANSRLSGLGLFQFLELHRQTVCVIEDAESVLRDRNALGVLRSATEGSQVGRDGRKLRKVTYHSHGKLRWFMFTGSIILTMNRGLSDLPEAEALATRLQVIDYSLGEDEIVELMYEICESDSGETRLASEERREVTNFVVRCARDGGFRLNLRMQVQAFQAYQLWDAGDAGTHWQDTVDSQIRRSGIAVHPIVPAQSRGQRMERERQVIREILHLSAEQRFQEWQSRTGKSRAAMYRRITDLGEVDAAQFDGSADES